MVKWLFFRLAAFDGLNDESDEPADEGNNLPLCLAAFWAIEPRKFRYGFLLSPIRGTIKQCQALFLHVRFVL